MTNDPVIPSVSFSARGEYVPALILEQCINIRALLATTFALQIEILSHLTKDDKNATADDYTEKLNEFTVRYAEQAKESMERQPPPE